VRSAGLGYDVFDCVLPTRDARHGRLYTFAGPPNAALLRGLDFCRRLYPLDREHTHQRVPVDEWCDCACCAHYSMAYLHHLFRIRDGLAFRLATIHNLRFYARLMEILRGTGGGADGGDAAHGAT
jgi:queuine tRNA-ribosyltransferase